VQGSTNSLGTVTKIDTSAGYVFTPRWSVDFGVPFYFVSPSASTTAATGATSVNGLGNVYGQVRFTLLNPALNYVSTVTGAAPTGDRSKGLSTGDATVDWSNYFDHGIGRLTPFAEIGAANSISDTEFFIRPYTTSGFVAHFQAGARYRLAPWMNVAASGYAIEAAGQQTVISRVVTAQKAAAVSNAAAGNKPVNPVSQKAVFETTTVTTGTSAIARDEGFSGWVQFGSSRLFNLYAGYTRSTRYDLNTLFFGVGTNLRKTVGPGAI
jgi:hypothetical protein